MRGKAYGSKMSLFLTKDPLNLENQYTSYLKENPNEYREVIEGVANVAARKEPGKSVAYGNYIDELCRKFFNGEEINANYVFEDGMPIKEIMTEDTLNKFKDQCKNIKLIYDALGWELVSERAVFTYQAYDEKLGKNVRVAGETDMIAVDR
jgi:hypothetical protein